VTHDSGLTWTVKTVPGSSAGSWDPSVGIATDGTVYFGYVNGDGHPYVAVSHDAGETWANLQDVGASFGIQNIAFPAVVAGDPDRAAFAFLGTATGGDLGGEDPTNPAVWHLYVAHTYDGGATWVTTDATPTDPVQRRHDLRRHPQPPRLHGRHGRRPGPGARGLRGRLRRRLRRQRPQQRHGARDHRPSDGRQGGLRGLRPAGRPAGLPVRRGDPVRPGHGPPHLVDPGRPRYPDPGLPHLPGRGRRLPADRRRRLRCPLLRRRPGPPTPTG
jgi:hypothetical protein